MNINEVDGRHILVSHTTSTQVDNSTFIKVRGPRASIERAALLVCRDANVDRYALVASRRRKGAVRR